MFPIIPERRRDNAIEPHPMSIPWSIAELAYSVYAKQYGTGQSLARLAERGGFHAGEMDQLLPDWRVRASELTAAQQRVTELESRGEHAECYLAKSEQFCADLTADNDRLRALLRECLPYLPTFQPDRHGVMRTGSVDLTLNDRIKAAIGE